MMIQILSTLALILFVPCVWAEGKDCFCNLPTYIDGDITYASGSELGNFHYNLHDKIYVLNITIRGYHSMYIFNSTSGQFSNKDNSKGCQKPIKVSKDAGVFIEQCVPLSKVSGETKFNVQKKAGSDTCEEISFGLKFGDVRFVMTNVRASTESDVASYVPFFSNCEGHDYLFG